MTMEPLESFVAGIAVLNAFGLVTTAVVHNKAWRPSRLQTRRDGRAWNRPSRLIETLRPLRARFSRPS